MNNRKFKVALVILIACVSICAGACYAWFIMMPSKSNVVVDIPEVDGMYNNAKVTVNGTSYNLKDLNKSVLNGTVVVDVEVDGRNVQGYVSYKEKILSPVVVLTDEDDYARVYLPSEEGVNFDE